MQCIRTKTSLVSYSSLLQCYINSFTPYTKIKFKIISSMAFHFNHIQQEAMTCKHHFQTITQGTIKKKKRQAKKQTKYSQKIAIKCFKLP